METLFDETLSINKNINIDANKEISKSEKINNRRNSCEKLTPLGANCKLEMHIENKNKVIYVSPRRVQYFLAKSSNCCGPIKVNYIGNKYSEKHSKRCGFLGDYYILNAGILFIPKKCLKPGAIDILPLVAYDGCNKYKFEAVFSYDSYKSFTR